MWNTIAVPLRDGWQCTLIPTLKYNDMMRWGHGYQDMTARRLYPNAYKQPYSYNAPPLSEFEKSQLWEKQRLRQLEQDQRTFARFFRPGFDLRGLTGNKALDDISTFLRDALGLAHWNMPKTNEDIQQILCKAVAQDRLIPVINYEYRGLQRVGLPDPAPQRWPTGGDGRYDQKILTWDEFNALRRANGELPAIDASAGSGAVVEPMADLGSAVSSGRSGGDGFDWLDTVETAAGAVFGGGGDSGDDDSAVEEDITGGAGDDSTPRGSAKPFEYQPDVPDGDSFDIAKTPNLGEPGTWYTNPGSGQMRLYGDDGKPVVDLDFDHVHNGLQPHAHNWSGGGRDGGDDVVPFSPWSR